MASKIKSTVLSIATQAGLLKRAYPESSISTFRDKRLIWKHTLQPSPLGDEYEIRMEYEIDRKPRVYVTNPDPLPLARNAKKLPHVYDQKKQMLCLYYPDGKQWNRSMQLTKTIVLWIYEWLYHYEIWLGTDDDWKGGGVHPFRNQPKKEEP